MRRDRRKVNVLDVAGSIRVRNEIGLNFREIRMRSSSICVWVCTALLCFCASAARTQISQATNGTKAVPLILEKAEGERRVVRGWPGHPDPEESFILKVDPKNGGSSHLVLLTASLAPGKEITAHRHPAADEILFIQTGTARVHLGDTVRDVHAGATVFIPANTWIAVSNVGSDVITVVSVFSAPGFEEFMRAGSVREGEKNVPMSPAEDEAIQKKHAHAVIYKEP
jgi:quercetin dioxygenase-like cupin family protein